MKGFASWLAAKTSILIFGVTLFAAFMQLHHVQTEYYQNAAQAVDITTLENMMKLMPENARSNVTLSKQRAVVLQPGCTITLDDTQLQNRLLNCTVSAASGQTITITKTGGMITIA